MKLPRSKGGRAQAGLVRVGGGGVREGHGNRRHSGTWGGSDASTAHTIGAARGAARARAPARPPAGSEGRLGGIQSVDG